MARVCLVTNHRTHRTNDAPPEAMQALFNKVVMTRPDIEADIKAMAGTGTDGRDVVVTVCGPDAMVRNAAEFAAKYNVGFHREIFHF
jgi:hypothetical protein